MYVQRGHMIEVYKMKNGRKEVNCVPVDPFFNARTSSYPMKLKGNKFEPDKSIFYATYS